MAVSEAQSAANIQGLRDLGYSSQQIGSYDYGNKLNPNEAQKFVQQMGPSAMSQAATNMQKIASEEYSFDPNQFLPGIQQQADAIYDPQTAQLQAIRLLQGSQYEDTMITTDKQFNDQMQAEIESINRRGAYFSGGAIQREQDLGDAKMRALNQLGLQASAADFANLAAQGVLAAEEAQFIQDRLFNAESGAYARWSDNRNFTYKAATDQYEIFASEQRYFRDVFTSDRDYDLRAEDAEMKRATFKQQYALDEMALEKAEKLFDMDLEYSSLNYEQKIAKFKSDIANTNSGVLGVNSIGEDTYDTYGTEFDNKNGVTTDTYGQGVPTQYSNTSNIINLPSLDDPDNW